MYHNGVPPAGYAAGGYPAGPGYMQPASGYGPQHNGYPPPAPHMHYPGAPPWPQHMQPPAAGYQQQYVQQPYPQYPHPQHGGPYPQSGYPAPQNVYPVPPQGMPYQQPGGMRTAQLPPGQNSSRASSRNSSFSGGQMGATAAPPQQQAAQASDGQMSITPAPVPASSQQPEQQRAPYAPSIDTAAVQRGDGSTMQGGSAVSTPGSASTRGGNSGSVLLAALQNSNIDNTAGSAQSSSTIAPDASGSSGQAAAVQGGSTDRTQPVGASSSGAGQGGVGASSSSSSMTRTQGGQGRQGTVDAKGIYLQGVPPDTTKEQLEAMFAAYGKILNVLIISIGAKRHVTKCAFVNFANEAAAQQALAVKHVRVNDMAVQVKPKVLKDKKVATGVTSSAQAAAQHLAKQQGHGAGTSSSIGSRQQSRFLGNNEQGLPMLRGAACCPFFLGTGACAFRAACKYHHPMHAMHPECVQHGKKPQRYDYIIPASYARLVNFTERLWDYDSCAEAQLKIWLARHLLASENSGCGMFDESAAVPAADEYAAYEDEAQPLGPYSCTIDEADQVLQLLWKAQPDEAAKQVMPYKGKLGALLGDDPYYDLAPDPLSGRMWVRLQVGAIKNLLNF